MRLLLLPLALVGLTACELVEDVPPEVFAVACSVGPAQFPDLADQIAAACDGLAVSAIVRVVR